jgi:hypothetical protein
MEEVEELEVQEAEDDNSPEEGSRLARKLANFGMTSISYSTFWRINSESFGAWGAVSHNFNIHEGKRDPIHA